MTHPLRELVGKATPGPWRYRPLKYDDWGMIRAPEDEDGGNPIVAQARLGRYGTEDEADAHRLAGTDPYEPNAALIVAMRNSIESLLDEVEGLRAALKPFAEWAEFYENCEQHPNGCPDSAHAGDALDITVGQLRAARQVLSSDAGEG